MSNRAEQCAVEIGKHIRSVEAHGEVLFSADVAAIIEKYLAQEREAVLRELEKHRQFFETLMDDYDQHFLDDGGTAWTKAMELGLMVEVPRTAEELEWADDDGPNCCVPAWSERAALRERSSDEDEV